MNEIIRKRKSIRKYDQTPLDTATLEKIREQIEKVTPLYPDIQYSIEIANKTKGLFNVKAPHYLIFGSEEKEGSLENIGFIGQQLDLFFSESGLGSCWLGGSKPEEKESSGTGKKSGVTEVSGFREAETTDTLPFVICMSFGKPAEPLHRTLSDFKRKPLSEISEGIDERLDAARLAPSGVNAQNWYFIAKDGKIHCYRKKANPILGFIYNKLACIDMGIALYHIAAESEGFNFVKESGVSERKGHVYMGTVTNQVKRIEGKLET
jgi:nitroreductase